MLAEDKEDHAQHKAAQDKRQKKEEAQQNVDDTIWEGFDILEDYVEIIKQIFEDLNQGSPWVRIKTREQLKK